MAKKKRKFASWADAELAYDGASKEVSVLEIALRELAFGKVVWLNGDFSVRRIGLCRLEAAHGGVVILSERGMVSAKYLDEWHTQVMNRPSPVSSQKVEQRAWLDVYRLANRAKEEQRIAQDKAAEASKGCSGNAPPQIVDQSVRTY